PTFYNYRLSLRGARARALVNDAPEMRYVSARLRRAWLALADQPVSQAQLRVHPLSMRILRELLPIHPRLLAGTDSGGGRPYMVPGFALHEELRQLVEAGLTPMQALTAATVEPAQAMRRAREFGTIEPGKRADLVLLRRDPKQSIGELAIEAVMARG